MRNYSLFVTSSNENVISIGNGGVIIAKKAGTATVTFANYNYSDTYKFKVVNKKINFKNPSQTILLSDHQYDYDGIIGLPDSIFEKMNLGEKFKLNAGMIETVGDNFTCCIPITGVKSSNPDVVSILGAEQNTYQRDRTRNSFFFSIEGVGKTTITFKVGNKAMKCKVNVIDPKLNETEVYKIVGRKLSLKVTGASGKVNWKSENKAVATVDKNGEVTAKDLGTTYIDAVVKGVTLRCKFTTEPVPQFVNIYQMKGIQKVVLADTVLRTSLANKFDTVDQQGGTKITYNWDTVGDITSVDYKDGKTYPVYDIERSEKSVTIHGVVEYKNPI